MPTFTITSIEYATTPYEAGYKHDGVLESVTADVSTIRINLVDEQGNAFFIDTVSSDADLFRYLVAGAKLTIS